MYCPGRRGVLALDFSFTPEQEAFRRHVRDFAEREIKPYVKEWDEIEQLPTRGIYRKMGEAGLLGISAAKEMGGMAAPMWT